MSRRTSRPGLIVAATLLVLAGCSQSTNLPGDDSLGKADAGSQTIHDAGVNDESPDASDIDETPDSGSDDQTVDSGSDDQTADAGSDDQTADSGSDDQTVDAGSGDETPDSGSIDDQTDAGGTDQTDDAGTTGDDDADAGTPTGNQHSTSHYPDPGATCPNGNGKYCGQTLGLLATTLYDCEAGVVQVAAQCDGRCVPGTNGLPDVCPCPDGDGLYCGDRIDRDPQTLYDCEQGQIRVKATCPGYCEDGSDGQSDQCPACPNGDGLACGDELELASGVLYDCEKSAATPVQTCSGECHENAPDAPDSCAGCPAGDGTYCGSRVGGAPNEVYGCESGNLYVADTCAGGCDSTGGADDACHTCPNDVDGAYCGTALGRDAKTLYDCADGVVTQKQVCTGDCVATQPDGDDTCAVCPNGNGLYCGDELGRDESTLYSCNDGVITVSQVCPLGCQQNDPGTPDACVAPECPDGTGIYCGSELGAANENELYECDDGALTPLVLCAQCQQNDPGTPDSCAACPNGDGTYCGDEVEGDSNTLYDCYSGELSVNEQCAYGCRQNAPGTPDDCAPKPCPDGDGLYCGAELGADEDTLYQCTDGNLTVSKQCVNGCHESAPGTPDECNPEACPNGDGVYCGAEVGGDVDTLFQCSGGQNFALEKCANGCQTNPPGTPDACRQLACPSGDGLYCGTELGQDESTLYQCANGNLAPVQQCPSGCVVESPGVADHCATAACDDASRAALSWEGGQLAQGNSYSDYCLGFVNQAFQSAGLVVPELQEPTAVDALNDYENEGALHDWDDAPPCGAIVFWDANDCNGDFGHVVIANGDGTVSTSGWPFFGGSTRAAVDWMDMMECDNEPVGWVDPL